MKNKSKKSKKIEREFIQHKNKYIFFWKKENIKIDRSIESSIIEIDRKQMNEITIRRFE